MRGTDKQQSGMFSYLSPEERVPEKHPLRAIRRMTDEVLKGLWAKFNELYSITGRPSIAPEKLLRALLLQILYTVRSERLLMEQLQYNLLFRWFVGLNMDEPVWVATVFTKNRDRLLEGEIANLFNARTSARSRRRMIRAISRWTFTARGAATKRTHRRRMRMRGWRARAAATRRSWPTAAMY